MKLLEEKFLKYSDLISISFVFGALLAPGLIASILLGSLAIAFMIPGAYRLSICTDNLYYPY